jgi:hypothetical protein
MVTSIGTAVIPSVIRGGGGGGGGGSTASSASRTETWKIALAPMAMATPRFTEVGPAAEGSCCPDESSDTFRPLADSSCRMNPLSRETRTP